MSGGIKLTGKWERTSLIGLRAEGKNQIKQITGCYLASCTEFARRNEIKLFPLSPCTHFRPMCTLGWRLPTYALHINKLIFRFQSHTHTLAHNDSHQTEMELRLRSENGMSKRTVIAYASAIVLETLMHQSNPK